MADIPHYPLTDFLNEDSAEKLAALLTSFRKQQYAKHGKTTKGARRPGTGIEVGGTVEVPPVGERPTQPEDDNATFEKFYKLFDGVNLCRLNGSVLTGKRNYYVYDIGLSSEKKVGFVLPNPFDTLLVFGGAHPEGVAAPGNRGLPTLGGLDVRPRDFSVLQPADFVAARGQKKTKGVIPPPKGKEPPKGRDDPAPKPVPHACDFNCRVYVSEKNTLEIIKIFGSNIQIYFSQGLVRPVRRNSRGHYVPTQRRQGVRLGQSVITLTRGRTPHLSAPLIFEDNLVQVGGRNVIVRLKQVTLGGTFAKPKLIFDQTEIIY